MYSKDINIYVTIDFVACVPTYTLALTPESPRGFFVTHLAEVATISSHLAACSALVWDPRGLTVCWRSFRWERQWGFLSTPWHLVCDHVYSSFSLLSTCKLRNICKVSVFLVHTAINYLRACTWRWRSRGFANDQSFPEIGSLYQRCFFVDKLTHIRIKAVFVVVRDYHKCAPYLSFRWRFLPLGLTMNDARITPIRPLGA